MNYNLVTTISVSSFLTIFCEQFKKLDDLDGDLFSYVNCFVLEVSSK